MKRITTLKAVNALFPALLVSLLVWCPLTHAAQDAKAGKQAPDFNERMGGSKSPIYINADRMEADNDQKIIIFESHVVVKQDDTTITSNRLKVTLLKGENQAAQPPKSAQTAKSVETASSEPTSMEKIDYIEFEGDVKVTQLDRLATANKAIFFQKEQKVVLKGTPDRHPVVTQGESRIEGELITLYLKENRSIVENQVKAFIPPEKKE